MDMELISIIKQASTNYTIDYISYEQKQELAKMYMEHCGKSLDMLCPRCIITACIEISKCVNLDDYGKGKRRKATKRSR
jgi:hypothetical protein